MPKALPRPSDLPAAELCRGGHPCPGLTHIGDSTDSSSSTPASPEASATAETTAYECASSAAGYHCDPHSSAKSRGSGRGHRPPVPGVEGLDHVRAAQELGDLDGVVKQGAPPAARNLTSEDYVILPKPAIRSGGLRSCHARLPYRQTCLRRPNRTPGPNIVSPGRSTWVLTIGSNQTPPPGALSGARQTRQDLQAKSPKRWSTRGATEGWIFD